MARADHVERVDRPSLAETRLRVKEPGSPGADWRTVDDSLQQLLFLPDTEVELTLKGSEKLAGIQLKVHPTSPPELKRLDERTFADPLDAPRGDDSRDPV